MNIIRYQSRGYVNQRNFVLAVCGLALVTIVGYFAYEFRYLRHPRLKVMSPASDVIAEVGMFNVRGITDPDADLTLNSRPLYSGETGEFEERISLAKGINRLEFEAKNRYGRRTSLVRYIVAK